MAEVIYQAMIPLNPRTKKNSQQLVPYYDHQGRKKHRIIQNAKYLEYEQDAGWFLKKPPVPISVPVNIQCIFYRDSDRRCDLTNLLEAIDDIMVKYGIIADDNFKVLVGHDGSRVYVDRKQPRTEIIITRIEE